MRRLMDNQDFKELILEGFLRDEAAQTAIASVHPAKHVREIAQLRLAGYGVLDSYLTETINLARQAEDALASDENLMDYVSTPGI